MSSSTLMFKYLGAAALGAAVVLASWSLASDPRSLLNRCWATYVTHLEARLRRLFLLNVSARSLARIQCLMAGLVAAAALYSGRGAVWLLLPGVAFGPLLYLARKRTLRTRAMEAKMDGFVLTVANALRSTPSIGNALAYSQPLVPPPFDEELALTLKELRVGSTIDEALKNMSAHTCSIALDAALSGILIGRQVGGNLTTILETTAETLREMARLQGVLKAKTAEGKGQLTVLAVFPAFILVAFDTASPGYFDPLTNSYAGYVVIVAACLLWVAAVVLARRILAVEL